MLKDKTVQRYLAVIIGLTIIAGILAYAFPEFAPLIILALISASWFCLQTWIVDLKRNINRGEKEQQLQLQTQNEYLSVTDDRISDISEMQLTIENRVRKAANVVNDIAGTTGRGAPLLREIHARSSSPTGEGAIDISPKKLTLPATRSSGKIIDTLSEVNGLTDLARKGERHRRRQVNVMVVADEFTAAAFEHEWNQIQPTPDNWKELLENNAIDLLFVESAWEGNSGSWRYHLVGQSAPRPAIVDLVDACKKRGIPTAFWNKEDPPHFEDFYVTAKLFDYIFTTEKSLIPEYERRLGAGRVMVLPFAAQPYYHNPARLKSIKRTEQSVFGGMYFRDKYPERRSQMNLLLPAAAEFGLDIYSRNTADPKYQYPEELQKYVLGTLPYPQMVSAYHAYKVVLNVNSVPSSESMCARRIFEATACGAAVVSSPTMAIENFFPGGLITTASNEDEARSRIRALIRSDSYRELLVHQAQRAVWERHTYSNRVNEILNFVEIPNEEESKDFISVIITTNQPDNIPYIIKNLTRQEGVQFELVLITHGFHLEEEEREQLESVEQVESVIVEMASTEHSLGENLNRLVGLSTGTFIVRMDDDDWYGPNYIRDLKNAAHFSGADLVGKAASYIYFEDRNATILTYETFEHRYTDFIRGATFAGPRSTFVDNPFPELGRSEDSGMLSSLLSKGGTVYSADRFNFVVNRHSDKGRHTWKVDDDNLFATGRMEFRGNGQEQLAV